MVLDWRPLAAVSFALLLGTSGVSVAQDKKEENPASPHTLAGNIGLFSSYRFCGIDQTFGKPALQGGIDYSHSSGLYAGNWNSNVNSGAGYPDGSPKGSHYWDLSATYDLGKGWGINGHVGSFKLKGWSTGTDLTNGNYTDWKIGVTKDISGWVFGLSYIDTNAKGRCNAANAGFYCFASSQNSAGQLGTRTKDAGRSTLVFSVTRTF